MNPPTYKNGIAAQVGDVVAVCTSGQKEKFLVVALEPINNPHSGTPPANPERHAVLVPYDELDRNNLDLSRFAVLYSDYVANPHIFEARA